MFNPFGFTPIGKTFAPRFFNNFGAAIYPAPLAQSMAILILFNLKFFGKLFLRILI